MGVMMMIKIEKMMMSLTMMTDVVFTVMIGGHVCGDDCGCAVSQDVVLIVVVVVVEVMVMKVSSARTFLPVCYDVELAWQYCSTNTTKTIATAAAPATAFAGTLPRRCRWLSLVPYPSLRLPLALLLYYC